MHLCWNSIWRKQFKVINLNFHTRLIPVHSPLLKNSHLVSDPPLTYMLKFSRLLCLMSCSCAYKAVNTMFTAMQVVNSKHCSNTTWCIKQYGLMHSHLAQIENNKNVKTLTQACPQECPKGTSAFNGQLIHGILQFTMIIALRCTLHQHVNQDICCWNYLCTLLKH